MEICDIINETEEGPKDAVRALKKRLNGNKNFREVMLTLTVLETCVKNCGHRFHVLVASRDFIDGVLVKIISPKSNPPTIVQEKVLALIQAWADAFRSSPDLTGVVHVYEDLKRKGVEFPRADLDALSPIQVPQRSTYKYSPPPQSSVGTATAPPLSTSLSPAYSTPQISSTQDSGPIVPNSEQIARLRSELDIVRGNAKVMSEMLTEMVPGQEDPSDLDLLQELNRTCRAMQQRIVELISHVSKEDITEELLHVNDDLNNIFLRYERYERYRSSRAAQTGNNGVLSEATEDNLIDLGPGSPAVVSPKISAAPPSSVTAAAPGPNLTPCSLSSQLARLDVGAKSVSGTLSSLRSCNQQDDFDVFARTRNSSLADPCKNAKTEGIPISAADGRQLTSGEIPVAQSSVMDDIEEWLCADVSLTSFWKRERKLLRGYLVYHHLLVETPLSLSVHPAAIAKQQTALKMLCLLCEPLLLISPMALLPPDIMLHSWQGTLLHSGRCTKPIIGLLLT
ncbi:TOM1-like protein 2-like [Scleropages formosus]|uniref:TOM1-like protein 2-like n=1 Tax=Scleropages formosus TaxID=113540 RepID=A0A0N8K0L5_SCLFO|nr:TOM1-like protein 2-like [Scleropages formosus]